MRARAAWAWRVFLLSALVAPPLAAQLAPGAPGEKPSWTNGNKQAVGTSSTLESKVWFTLADGVLTEVYYPRVDVANTRKLELLVADGQGFFESESADCDQRVESVDSSALAFRQVNASRSGRWRTTKTVIADPDRSAVLVRVRFERLKPGALRLFAFLDPAVANSGLHDSGYQQDGALVTEDAGVGLALVSSSGFAQASSGYLGTSDGLRELRAGQALPRYARAADGNVAQLAELRLPPGAQAVELTLALGFASEGSLAVRTARAALERPFADTLLAYRKGWNEYVASLRTSSRHPALFRMAAMQLKAHEDKTARGAMVASLTKPWGHESDASEATVGGYHLVWSRDLYHVATALAALGDKGAADRALSFLFDVQQRPDGSFPQNSWLDGRPYWTSLQLDEVAYPLILAHELGRNDGESWVRHVRPAAEFLVARGPATPQERWEEEGGYSPSTIAAEIAGLVAAAAIAEHNRDLEAAERYRGVARDWAARVEGWTVARSGPHSERPHFLRLSQQGRPDSGQALEINNGSGSFDEREIVDAGFLELVRLGIRPPGDPLVAHSLEVVDRVLRVETPSGPGFYRYNHDGYGEKADGRGYDGTGVGRLWPLLTGERGEYELLRGGDAARYLDALAAFANQGLMLPEQVWDRPDAPRSALRFGAGTGSATPLAWSCAGFIRLALALEDGRPVGQPRIVREFFQGAAQR